MKRRITVNTETSIEILLEHEEAKRILEEHLPEIMQSIQKNPIAASFTIRQMGSFAPAIFTPERIQKVNDELTSLEIFADVGYSAEHPVAPAAAEVVKEATHDCFRPGGVMRDTSGRRIQAHGGAIFYEDGIFYWYGENKDRTDGISRIWTWGIRAYKSSDLYNWEDMGLIIKPDLDNQESSLYPEKHVDRPHIIKCKKTNKYVCWIKQCGDEACFMVLTSDSFCGPYTIEKEQHRPYGIEVGDFDIAIDEETGTAYLYMDGNHSTVYGFELTDDYIAVKREVSQQYIGFTPPLCREGVTLFERNGKKYMITSGMSGYVPNRSDCAETTEWTIPFASIGDPHVGDVSSASFNSQISQVFKVPGKKDLYISIADRWVPDFPVDARLADMITRFVGNHHDPAKYPISAEEQAFLMNSPMVGNTNTSVADYIWLPVIFEEDVPKIYWRDQWKLEDFE